jgi:alcohol dehydrogenase class IV
MSKREKYQHAVAVLEETLCRLDVESLPEGAIKNIAARRRKQLCDAIVALGGPSPDDPDEPGGTGGGPGTRP